MSESTTTFEDNHSFGFDKGMSQVKVELDKSREEQKNTVEEEVEQDTNSSLEIKINQLLQIQTPSTDDEMDIKFEAPGIESNWTPGAEDDLKSESETGLIPDWKLSKNVECRVTLARMRNSPSAKEFERRVSSPYVQSGVRESKVSTDIPILEFDTLGSKVKVELDESGEEQGSTFRGHQDEKDEEDPNSVVGKEISGDPLQIEPFSVDEEIGIKHEVNDIEHTSNAEDDLNTSPMLSEINSRPLKDDPINTEENELNQLYLDLLQCERDCGTCQKYIRKLREHVRCAHATTESTCDSLHIDRPEMGQSSFIEVKCEEDKVKVIESMDCSEETESDPDFDVECGRDSGSDPDYNTSQHVTRYVHPGNVVKENVFTELEFPNEATLTVPDIQSQFPCTTCGQSFVSKYRLSVHEWTHTGETPYTCETCSEGFVSKYRLRQHEQTHNGGKTQRICIFATKYHLTSHLRTHAGDKPFKCDECEESFSQRCNLQRHMRIHTGDKLFKCETCGKHFARSDGLTLHMRYHTGDKPFKCETCGKHFARNDGLTLHMRYHTGEKPFKCSECEMSFTKSFNLSRHKRRIHKYMQNGIDSSHTLTK